MQDVQLFKWYQNDNIVQEVDVLSTALKASALVATNDKFGTYLY